MEDWKITDTTISYRGVKQDLPEFLPGFTIPLPNAWFDVLFRERKRKGKVVYQAEAYGVATGYLIYDFYGAYGGDWAEALKGISFAV